MKFKNLLITAAFFNLITSAFAGSFTPSKTMRLNFSETDIDVSKVKVTYQYWCNYNKKFLDIIEGRIGERTVSCGKTNFDLKIVNNEIELPGIEQFNGSKAEDLNRYGMQLKIDYQDRNLIWISVGQSEKIQNFFKKPFDLNFRKFELNDLEINFKGMNLIDSPEFKGKDTEVTTYFYADKKENSEILDTDFTRSFKWYLTPYTTINKNNPSKLGKISIPAHYHAFVNDQVQKLHVEIYAKNIEEKFVTANLIEILFTQDAIDNLRDIELTDIH